MRRLLVLTTILFSIFSANAQSESETLEWLNVKKVDLSGSDYQYNTKEVYLNHHAFPKNILWSEIKEISISGQDIVIKGKAFEYCKSSGCTWSYKELTDLKIYCSNADEDLKQRFVKALKHIATLKGAKFVKEDLF